MKQKQKQQSKSEKSRNKIKTKTKKNLKEPRQMKECPRYLRMGN